VARTAARDRELPRRVRKLGEVGSCGEDERFAGQDERRPDALLELRKQTLQRLQRGSPEERRLRVILAVVDRDERKYAGVSEIDPRELELGLRQRGSPR
jgi:hypothetical protein